MADTIKITKRMVLESLIEMADNGDGSVDWPDIRAYAVNELTLLDNKAKKAKERAEKAKAENDALGEAVYEATSTEPATLDVIAARVEFDGDFSVSKVGARLRRLKEQGRVDKVEVKVKPAEGGKTTTRVAYFRVAEEG